MTPRRVRTASRVIAAAAAIVAWGLLALFFPSQLIPGYEHYTGHSWPALMHTSPATGHFILVAFRLVGALNIAVGLALCVIALTLGAENLCHQAIFMNHASGVLTPPDAEAVQVGDAFWQRAERRGLVQGAVWPVRVVEVHVLAQDGHQMPLIPYQGPVQQLTSAAPIQRSMIEFIRGA